MANVAYDLGPIIREHSYGKSAGAAAAAAVAAAAAAAIPSGAFVKRTFPALGYHLQESHCSPIHQVAFNPSTSQLHNLVATVGKDQATIYDDQHMGDYVAIVVHFTNNETPYTRGGVSEKKNSKCSSISCACRVAMVHRIHHARDHACMRTCMHV